MIRVIVFDCIALIHQYYSIDIGLHTKQGRQKLDSMKTKTRQCRDKSVTSLICQRFRQLELPKKKKGTSLSAGNIPLGYILKEIGKKG